MEYYECVVALGSFYQNVQQTGRSCFLAHEVVGSFRVSPESCCWNFHAHGLACAGMKYFCKYSLAIIKALPYIRFSF